jgi:hypothetical protein
VNAYLAFVSSHLLLLLILDETSSVHSTVVVSLNRAILALGHAIQRSNG